jgi:hypothetical protein
MRAVISDSQMQLHFLVLLVCIAQAETIVMTLYNYMKLTLSHNTGHKVE